MKLKGLFEGLRYNQAIGSLDVDINEIAFDSRKVEASDLFVAIKGNGVDGHDFIESAIRKGAKAIVCESIPEILKEGIVYLKVEDSSFCLAQLASKFYGNPSKKLKLVGVTGTNGKTTMVTLLYKLFKGLGYKVGMLSTVENIIDDVSIPSTHTTGDALQINQLLSKMVEEGVSHCFMEVSSHAIDQNRISGLVFDGAVFTNISHDHLDYHNTFSEYIKVKKKLFDDLPKASFALVNSDDKRGEVMLQNTKASKFTFALNRMADFKSKLISNTLEGLELDFEGQSVWFSLIGKFNAYNLLSVYAVAVLLNEDKLRVLEVLSSLKSASGRFDLIPNQKGVTAIVDYAHTPDALENVLKTIHDIGTHHKVMTVVGCGGNRDTTKRPIMASVAQKYSDILILTSDNPRFEEPNLILSDMKAGIKEGSPCQVYEIEEREKAMKSAVEISKNGDVILIAGKGHEDYQDIKGVKHPFDDKKILEKIFNQHI